MIYKRCRMKKWEKTANFFPLKFRFIYQHYDIEGGKRLLNGRGLMIERIKKRLNAQYIASEIGVSKSYISKLENEHQTIPVHIYKKWIKILNSVKY